MKKEEKDWKLLKYVASLIATDLKNNEGITTIERRKESQVLTVIIPIEGKAVIHNDDVPRCRHIQ